MGIKALGGGGKGLNLGASGRQEDFAGSCISRSLGWEIVFHARVKFTCRHILSHDIEALRYMRANGPVRHCRGV